jgi:hypothetical protein
MTDHSKRSIHPRPQLVIDGSGSLLFAGILDHDLNWLGQHTAEGAALENLFATVENALQAANVELSDLGTFIYNAGPGSVLGLRLTAMALQTWAQLNPAAIQFKAYNTLQLAMRLLRIDQPDLQDALIVSDWKKGAWNALYLTEAGIGTTEVVDDALIEAYPHPTFHLPQRKGWQSPPANAKTISLLPVRLPEVYHEPNFLKSTQGVELYTTAINTFQKWTPERHRAKGT